MRLELIYKEGKAFWVPAKGAGVTINGFVQWEQVFRVYSNVYTKEHSHHASELIEYNHIIHTISMQYTWNNDMHTTVIFICIWPEILTGAGQSYSNKLGIYG